MYLEPNESEKLNKMTEEEILKDPDAFASTLGLNFEVQGCDIIEDETGGKVLALAQTPMYAYSVLVKEGDDITVKVAIGAPGSLLPDKLPKTYIKIYSEEEVLENQIPVFCPPEFSPFLTPTDDPDIQALRDYSREEAYKRDYELFESDPQTPTYIAEMEEKIAET